MQKWGFLYVGLLCLGLGCVGPTERPKPRLMTGTPERVIRKNYSLGSVKTVKTGETIAEVEDFWVLNKVPNFIVMDRPVSIQTETRVVDLPLGRLIKYMGTVTINQVDYVQYLDAHDDDGLGEIYYLKPNMTLAPFLYLRDRRTYPTGMVNILRVTPAAFRFPAQSVTEMMKDKDYQHRELIFDGMDAQGIHVTCKEQTPGGSADQPEPQTLTFPVDAAYLRYGTTQVRVHKCTGSEIVVSVVAD